MASFELDIPYTLTGPDGSIAVFNKPDDPNYVGVITELTGLDSPDVRENSDDLIQQDGGLHGNFYYGRRPITLTGIILNPVSTYDRNVRMDRLSKASNAMRADATLSWTPTGGEKMFVKVRRQQPLRMTGAWQKSFQLAVVAEDPVIYSSVEYSDESFLTSGTATLNISNDGTANVYPTIQLYGEITNPVVAIEDDQVAFTYLLVSGHFLEINTKNRTVFLDGTTNNYSAVNLTTTSLEWVSLFPGSNVVTVTSSGSVAPARLVVKWRNGWI